MDALQQRCIANWDGDWCIIHNDKWGQCPTRSITTPDGPVIILPSDATAFDFGTVDGDCSHLWTLYHGLKETFEYCKICGQRRT